MSSMNVSGFEVRVDRLYDLSHHMWVELLPDQQVRIGMDSLGVETAGTLAHLVMADPGGVLDRGEAFGSLEAEKFVGPLVAPVAGVITAVNDAVGADPGLVHRQPYDGGWLIEMTPSHLDRDLASLVGGEEAVRTRFAEKVTEYRLEGVLAE